MLLLCFVGIIYADPSIVGNQEGHDSLSAPCDHETNDQVNLLNVLQLLHHSTQWPDLGHLYG